MKLIINYDLDAIRNVNEPISPFKIVRNRKYEYLTFQFPLLAFFDFCSGDNVLEMIETLGMQFGMIVCMVFVSKFEWA